LEITFLLLAHQKPAIVQRLLEILTSAGYSVAIHYDLKAPAADYAVLTRAFADHPKVRFARRVRVGWGEWSIVAATLNCLEEIEAAGWNPDYVYYASGTDYPIRAASELAGFLTRNRGTEYIEGVPANVVPWVRGGPQKERYEYRFYFSWRDHHKLSQRLLRWQKVLRLKRKFVLGLEPYIGSQWWVLTWDTLQRVMQMARRPEVVKFFRTTLIPDEIFFQTMVYNLIPRSRIVPRPLTLSQFTDYMVPVIFYSDHVEYLLRQPFFMARKLSPYRPEVYDALDACWRGERSAFVFDDEQIGKVSSEFEETRVAQRHGMSGLPIIGRPSDPWSGGLERLEQPYFAVLGTSAAELRFAHALLSGHQTLLCHGQLFHQNSVEFAHGVRTVAGYGRLDIALRNLSAPDFLADLIRAEPERQTGFLLRFGQGWHIPEVLFNRPNAKMMVIYGDPLIGFIESLAGVEPLIENALDSISLRSFPPTILVKKFEEYEKKFQLSKHRISMMVATSKPKGKPANWSWLTELDLDIDESPRVGHRGPRLIKPVPKGWVESTLARWRDWFVQAETCLGVKLTQHADRRIWSRFAGDLAILARNRQLLVDLLIAGGLESPLLEIAKTDKLSGPLAPEQAVAAAIAQMVAAGFANRAAAADPPLHPEQANTVQDGSVPAMGSAGPGNGTVGNGTTPHDPSDPFLSTILYDVNEEPLGDPATSERSPTTNPSED
jgi:Core-2/I-Branching enzyme